MKLIQQINNDILNLHKLRNEYMIIHKRLKTYKLNKINKKIYKSNSSLLFKHMIHFNKILSVRETDNFIIYNIKSQSHQWDYNVKIPLKYKNLNPIPFEMKKYERPKEFNIKIFDNDIDVIFYRNCFLLSNKKIYIDDDYRYEIYANLKEFIDSRYSERIKTVDRKFKPFYTCDFCKDKELKSLNEHEMFYEVLSYNLAKSKGLNVICCKLHSNEYTAARIIQHHIKHWLYSAPNGLMFKKQVRELQSEGFLLT